MKQIPAKCSFKTFLYFIEDHFNDAGDEDCDNEDGGVEVKVKVETAETVKVPTLRRLVVG